MWTAVMTKRSKKRAEKGQRRIDRKMRSQAVKDKKPQKGDEQENIIKPWYVRGLFDVGARNPQGRTRIVKAVSHKAAKLEVEKDRNLVQITKITSNIPKLYRDLI